MTARQKSRVICVTNLRKAACDQWMMAPQVSDLSRPTSHHNMSAHMTKHDRIELTSNELDHVSGGSGPRAFEIKDFSFGIENPTTIGSATGGAGAGKIKFNEFLITKTTDKASPNFF